MEIPFQLSTRTITIPITDEKPERVSVQAVVVKTSVEHAAMLQECFYSLGAPVLAHQVYPYIGKYQFIP